MGLFDQKSNTGINKVVNSVTKSFAVDVIKWEPGDESGASLIAHKYESEDFVDQTVLSVAPYR